jgi:hypothetical protein
MTPWLRDRYLAAKANPRIRPDMISSLKSLDPSLTFPNYDKDKKLIEDLWLNMRAAEVKRQELLSKVATALGRGMDVR